MEEVPLTNSKEQDMAVYPPDPISGMEEISLRNSRRLSHGDINTITDVNEMSLSNLMFKFSS
jgi:hypothetical protein